MQLTVDGRAVSSKQAQEREGERGREHLCQVCFPNAAILDVVNLDGTVRMTCPFVAPARRRGARRDEMVERPMACSGADIEALLQGHDCQDQQA